MITIDQLSENQFDSMVHLVTNAYTEFDYHLPQNEKILKERLLKVHKEDDTVNFWGYYSENEMVGCMRFHDFIINLHKKKMQAGGIGLVAVDLLHKKEKIAKNMVTFFLDHYRGKGALMAMLYPFRPDFYKRMGFGFGSKMNLYKIKPQHFPKGTSKEHLRFLSKEDTYRFAECYSKYTYLTNGLLDKTKYEIDSLFNNPENRILGFEKNNELTGYCVFTFRKNPTGSFFVNDIHIKELVYLNNDALSEFFTFLHSQADQVHQVVIHTQDEDFYFLFDDPRDGSDQIIPFIYHQTNTSGTGLMYRVLDVDGLFTALEGQRFGHQDLVIKWNINDDLIEVNSSPVITTFIEGCLTKTKSADFDVEVSMNISDFSSLITGAVSFHSLVKYRLASVSDEIYIDDINDLLTAKKPICFSGF